MIFVWIIHDNVYHYNKDHASSIPVILREKHRTWGVLSGIEEGFLADACSKAP